MQTTLPVMLGYQTPEVSLPLVKWVSKYWTIVGEFLKKVDYALLLAYIVVTFLKKYRIF